MLPSFDADQVAARFQCHHAGYCIARSLSSSGRSRTMPDPCNPEKTNFGALQHAGDRFAASVIIRELRRNAGDHGQVHHQAEGPLGGTALKSVVGCQQDDAGSVVPFGEALVLERGLDRGFALRAGSLSMRPGSASVYGRTARPETGCLDISVAPARRPTAGTVMDTCSFGVRNWEIDTIIGKGHQEALLSIVDQITCFSNRS